jgi:hypothetical protein
VQNADRSIGASPAANAPAPGPSAGPGGGRRGGGQGRPGQAAQRPVVAGLIDVGDVEIKDGLEPGEIVVADGLNKMQPGIPVNYCAAQLPQGAPPAGGRSGARGGPSGGRDAIAPGALGRPGGQSGGGSRLGRPGGPGGRVAGASR